MKSTFQIVSTHPCILANNEIHGVQLIGSLWHANGFLELTLPNQVSSLLRASAAYAQEALGVNSDILDEMVAKLMEDETLDGAVLDAFLARAIAPPTLTQFLLKGKYEIEPANSILQYSNGDAPTSVGVDQS